MLLPAGSSFADQFLGRYNRAPAPKRINQQYEHTGRVASQMLGTASPDLLSQGFGNLYEMLLNQGRMDPRLLASMLAGSSRQTTAQQGTALANATRSGFGNSGLSQAMQSAIGAAGANRAADIQYQDIADSYGRNQQNLGLLSQLVMQPSIDFAQTGAGISQANKAAAAAKRAAQIQMVGSLFGTIGSLAGGAAK